MTFADREAWTAKEVAKLLALVNSGRRTDQEILENLPAGLVVLALDLSVFAANRTFRVLFRLGDRPLSEIRFEDLFPEERMRRQVLEVLDTPGVQRNFEARQGSRLRITARSYGSWPETRKVILLVQQGSASELEEVDLPGAEPRAVASKSEPAGGKFPAVLRAGIILAFVLTGVLYRLFSAPGSRPRSKEQAPLKVVPFPGRGTQVLVPEALSNKRTATG
jgi:PAS domain-containing protein